MKAYADDETSDCAKPVDVSMDDEDNEDPFECERIHAFLLFKKHSKDVYTRMKQFKDELLASTLEFMLSLPKQLVEIRLDDLVPCLEVSLFTRPEFLQPE
jgi:hypothetical protein